MSKFCPKCGNEIKNIDIKFCPKCGFNNKKSIFGIKFNTKYITIFISILIVAFVMKPGFDIYYKISLNNEQSIYKNIFKNTNIELEKSKTKLEAIGYTGSLSGKRFVFRVNSSFNSLEGNDLFEDSNSILTKLVMLQEESMPERIGFLDKLIFIRNKEQNGYFIKEYKSQKDNKSSFLDSANALDLGFLFEKNIFDGFECRHFSKYEIKNNKIISYNGNGEEGTDGNKYTNKIINNSGGLNGTSMNEGCFAYSNNEFLALNNTFLLRDEFLKYKNSKDLYLSIVNIDGYIEFILFKGEQKIFSTLDQGNKPFKEISIPFSYEKNTGDCEEWKTEISFLYVEKKCIKYKYSKYEIKAKVKLSDSGYVTNFFSTNSYEDKKISIGLFNNNFQISKDEKTDLPAFYIPSNFHKSYLNLKNNIKINVYGEGNFDEDIKIDNISIK